MSAVASCLSAVHRPRQLLRGRAQAGFYDVLLCLADWCPIAGVKFHAMRLLDALPTDRHTLALLRAAITSPDPAQALAPLLAPAAAGLAQTPAPLKPARLLYTLQVRVRASALSWCSLLPLMLWSSLADTMPH